MDNLPCERPELTGADVVIGSAAIELVGVLYFRI